MSGSDEEVERVDGQVNLHVNSDGELTMGENRTPSPVVSPEEPVWFRMMQEMMKRQEESLGNMIGALNAKVERQEEMMKRQDESLGNWMGTLHAKIERQEELMQRQEEKADSRFKLMMEKYGTLEGANKVLERKVIANEQAIDTVSKQMKETKQAALDCVDQKCADLKKTWDVKFEESMASRGRRTGGAEIDTQMLKVEFESAGVSFTGSGENHPMGFVRKFNKIAARYGLPSAQKLRFLGMCLKGKPLIWLQDQEFENFTTFESAFQAKYWNSPAQDQFINIIYNGKYQFGHQSMSEYISKLVTENQYLPDPINDQNLAKRLIKHFPAKTYNMLIHKSGSTADIVKRLAMWEGEEAVFVKPDKVEPSRNAPSQPIQFNRNNQGQDARFQNNYNHNNERRDFNQGGNNRPAWRGRQDVRNEIPPVKVNSMEVNSGNGSGEDDSAQKNK
jgi:hypothetical protein